MDCRKGSPTLGREVIHEFEPSPLRMLVIPPGVAHAFEGLGRIFTINRPLRRGGDPELFEPGNDVIDWPLEKRPAPAFQVKGGSFPFSYYARLAQIQRDYIASREGSLSTPSVLLVDDGSGKQVKVALRRVTGSRA
jgi:hypothetical protein